MEPDRDAAALACTLAPAALRDRQAELVRQLAPTVVDVEETANGYRFRFEASADRLRQLAELVAFEKDCCSFLDFALEWRARSRGLSFTLSGPEGAKAAIREMFVAPLEDCLPRRCPTRRS